MLVGIKHITEIGGFKLKRVCEDMGVPVPHYLSNESPMVIDESLNMIAFKIQKGPIEEVGVNGCGQETIIETVKVMLEEADKTVPHHENGNAIGHLQMAMDSLKRRADNNDCEDEQTVEITVGELKEMHLALSALSELLSKAPLLDSDLMAYGYSKDTLERFRKKYRQHTKVSEWKTSTLNTENA